jgi:hypothetical protein
VVASCNQAEERQVDRLIRLHDPKCVADENPAFWRKCNVGGSAESADRWFRLPADVDLKQLLALRRRGVTWLVQRGDKADPVTSSALTVRLGDAFRKDDAD